MTGDALASWLIWGPAGVIFAGVVLLTVPFVVAYVVIRAVVRRSPAGSRLLAAFRETNP